MRIGFFSALRTRSGYALPPLMLVNEPTVVKTFRNASGRCQATVKAQMPPDELPAMQRPSGLSVNLYFFETSGRISSRRNLEYASLSVSYSLLRLDRTLDFPSDFFSGSPGLSA